MHRKLRPAVVALTLLLVLSAVQAGIRIESDETVDFSKYRSFAWAKGTPAARAEVEEWIVAAVESELRARGLVRIIDGESDLLVSTIAFGQYDGGVTGGHMVAQTRSVGITRSDVHDVSYGNLIVDLVDAGTGRLVWRAIAKSGVKGDAKKLERKIGKITRKMFSRYPE